MQTDTFENTCKNAFENFEVAVNPHVWENVQQHLQTPPTLPFGSSVISGIKSIIIAGVAIIAATTAVIVYKTDTKNEQVSLTQVTQPTSNPIQATAVTQTKPNLQISAGESHVPAQNHNKAKAPLTINEITYSSEKTSSDNSNDQPSPHAEANSLVTQNKVASHQEAEINIVSKDEKHENISATDDTATETKPAETKANLSFDWGVISNTFTPNADGKNDVFKISLPQATQFNVSVYNINGKLLHEWQGEHGFWDGKDAWGYDLPKGMYMYIIVATDFNGSTHKTKGSISILK